MINDLGDDLSAFAVVSSFATRNPSHEILVRDLIRKKTGKPVTCSSDLSARLNGPKRAITSVLNARLIGLIDRLICASKFKLQAFLHCFMGELYICRTADNVVNTFCCVAYKPKLI